MRNRFQLHWSRLRGVLVLAAFTSAIGIGIVVSSLGPPRFWSLQAGSKYTVFIHLENLRLTICVGRSTAARSSGLIYFILRRIQEKTEEREEYVAILSELLREKATTDNLQDVQEIGTESEQFEIYDLRDRQQIVELDLDHAFFYATKTLSELIRARGYCGVLFCLNPTPSEFVVLSIPGWLQLGILSIGPLALVVRIIWHRRFSLPTACGRCSYNLIGITSPVCPECGTPIPEEQEQSIA